MNHVSEGNVGQKDKYHLNKLRALVSLPFNLLFAPCIVVSATKIAGKN